MLFSQRCWPWFYPVLLSMCLAGWFVVSQPGDLRKDAAQYDQLARSLVQGQGFALQGVPTMIREPGYPVFRALVYRAGGGPATILWIQVVLVGLIVGMIGAVFRGLDAASGATPAWGAAVAYGFSVYAAAHYSEVFTGFLVAAVGWSCWRWMETRRRWYGVLLVASSAALALTRMNMALIPPLLFLAAACQLEALWRKRLKIFLSLGLVWIMLLSPWVIRNGLTFNEWGIAGRSGIQLYARMVKAREPASRLGASYFSVIFSRAASAGLGWQPIFVEDQWLVIKERAKILMDQRLSEFQIDRTFRREAWHGITAKPYILVSYIAWTPVEVLRLWALPSFRSRHFPIENSFYLASQVQSLSVHMVILLVFAHLLQLIVWCLMALSLYAGWKRFRWRWIPVFMFLAVTAAHLPFDAIIRYGVPVQPWLWAVIVWYIHAALGRRSRAIKSSH